MRKKRTGTINAGDSVLHTRLCKETVDELKAEAKKRGQTVSQLVRYIVSSWLEDPPA